jgi:hypothetical protein
MRTYHGWVGRDRACHVVIREKGKHWQRLPLRLDLYNHSPTGFAWGYGGSGPSQLALALLADVLADDKRALRLYMDFKWAVVEKWDQDKRWSMSEALIRAYADSLERKQIA